MSVIAPSASAADDYPHKSADTGEVDSRGFYFRQCTSFVAFRMSQRGEFTNRMTGPNGKEGYWYNAMNWPDNARQIGFTVDTNPIRGAIAQWGAGESGARDLGHVAYVDQVNADGTVFVEEYNWTNPNAYSRRGPLRAPRYIHVYDYASSPAPPPPAPQTPIAKARVEPVAIRAPVASVAPRDTKAPVGQLIAPAFGFLVERGETIEIKGRFSDDRGVEKVTFSVSADRGVWRAIGEGVESDDDIYTFKWTVNYSPGTKMRLTAEAVDQAGNKTTDTLATNVAAAPPAPRPRNAGRSWLIPLSVVLFCAVLLVLILRFALARKRLANAGSPSDPETLDIETLLVLK